MNRMIATCLFAICVASTTPLTHGKTILKLGLGNDSAPDIEMKDGVLRTFDDQFGATIGDQNTEASFLDVLNGIITIEGDRASFSLWDVQLTDDAPVVIGLDTLVQLTQGGRFALYGPNNDELLLGTLGNGTVWGAIGDSGTGSFLTTKLGNFTGGSLWPTLQANNLFKSSFSVSLTNVNGGDGLMLGTDGRLLNFTADATANIGAQVPEPTGAVLAALGTIAFLGRRRED